MSCNDLTVSTTIPGVTISPAGEKHGHIENALPTQITYGNTGAYGPDAKIYVYKDLVIAAVLEVQQDYCFLEAGKITVTLDSGKCTWDITEGAYAGGIGGQVRIITVG